MRRRIVRTILVVTSLTLLLFCVAVTWVAGSRIDVNERGEAQAQAQRIATGLSAAFSGDSASSEDEAKLTLERFTGYLRPGEQIVVVTPDGRTLVFGEPDGDQHVVASSTGQPFEVTVRQRGDDFESAALRVGSALAAVGVVALLAAWFVARRLADRLVEPLGDLAAAAARLGRGDARPAGLRYGIEELDAVAEVLDVSAQRIGAQLSTERRLASDVSHQLRTPLTALSMRLEEVLATGDPDVARAEAEVALQQVERLSRVVDDLLAYARNAPAEQADVELDVVLAQQADEWRGAYGAAGRTLVVTGRNGLVARASASGLGQVVATLLENSLVHGAGVTTVRTRMSGRWAVVDVSDEGPGVPAELGRRVFERDVSGASSTGLGLAVARALTEVEGGRLELTRRAPATFSVFLAPVASSARSQLTESSTDSSAAV